MKYLHLKNTPIFNQLQIEEALLRTSQESFCIIGEKSPPSIVLGISNKIEDSLHLPTENIPIIKRFSGGGTVFIDEDTIFISFIFSKNDNPIPITPKNILTWGETFYKKAFALDKFNLQENDFTIENKKYGGNALYLKKDRWLLHTSFLWDYKEENMKFLKMPIKTPKYRNARDHINFIGRLKDFFPSRKTIISSIKTQIQKEFQAKPTKDIENLLTLPHRRATHLI